MLEKLRGTIDKGITAVSAKSESLVETNKTKGIMSNAQKAMDAEMGALGRRFYNDWKTGSVDMAAYVPDIERIMQIERDIENCRYRLEEIKREEEARIMNSGMQYGSYQPGMGVQPMPPMGAQPMAPMGAQPGMCICPNCGRQLPMGSRFCDGCGAQLG